MDEFWHQVAKFVFNVSNLLFSQVPTLYRQTQTNSGNVENTVNQQTRFGSPLRDPFLTLLHPPLWICKSEACVVQTNQPQSQWQPRWLLAQLQYWLKKHSADLALTASRFSQALSQESFTSKCWLSSNVETWNFTKNKLLKLVNSMKADLLYAVGYKPAKAVLK